ncbi:hypothetical protein NE237_025451 [Protea cynaroides]|uniref:MYB transcription factor n=1 Tax=Protea cynaroides TaxID=273540 RepID=A0A9Q0K1C6_9MAGN|nr:hypothetical protein NE237_025451 [Protea cynaroides]
MGAPKQKWTAEEEAALKAGVVKHGAGKWRTILKDAEFSSVLSLRSNVDLKDKWRNMNVTANGYGSRHRGRLAIRRNQSVPKYVDNPKALSTVVQSDEEIVDAKPLAVSDETLQIASPKRSIPRLENIIMEAITNLKEPGGSNKIDIATYIENQYWPRPNFKRELSAKLKNLTASGKLIKVRRKYRIAPCSTSEGRSSGLLLREGRPRYTSRIDKDDIKILTKSQIDAELAKIRNMTAQEAAAFAAQAVAEAEAAMAEAEEAAKEAEAAEADAEAAQVFAEAAMLTLKDRKSSKTMINT